jgi:hypothetical protein
LKTKQVKVQAKTEKKNKHTTNKTAGSRINVVSSFILSEEIQGYPDNP